MLERQFPEQFLWGAATSAFQIEGATDAEGRGPSIWDDFCKQPGRIEDGSDGRVACDHFHRYREDVQILQDLGLNAYRFSIAWSRVFPDGLVYNPSGLSFYERLVDTLLESGIEPWVTLYHWDMPQGLHERGGWPARESAERFGAYAEAVVKRVGDRVRHWITINEPWCASMLGYLNGEHAPGERSLPRALRAAHHLLLAHGRGTEAIRAHAPEAQVGITLNMMPGEPASRSPEDAEACRRFDGVFNRWYADPIFKGQYPADTVRDYVAEGGLPDGLDFVHRGDMEAISAPTDFLGINYYTRAVLRSDQVPEAENAPRLIPIPEPGQLTDMGWEIYPRGLEELLLRVHRDYAPPAIYITENGAAFSDGPDERGEIQDTRRTEFLFRHLSSCHAAIQEGVPLAGYFVWSLLDNFEWAHGYTKRFGITWVDYETQRRLLKASGRFYQSVVKTNALAREKVT